LATAYHLVRLGAEVTVYDPSPPGEGGASSVAAGMLHPLTPRGRLIWKGEEGLASAMELIAAADAALAVGNDPDQTPFTTSCITCRSIVRPIMDQRQWDLMRSAADRSPQLLAWLSREELLRLAPGVSRDCLAGVRITGALALDSRAYLRGLWRACTEMNAAVAGVADDRGGNSGGNGGGSGNGSGAGVASKSCRARWVRERVDDAAALAAAEGYDAVVAAIGAAVVEIRRMGSLPGLRLYVVPGGGNSLICGATQEHILPGVGAVATPTDVASATAELLPKV
ncbi:unnamed protein product, partial [Phaeothamnion confervicola]